MIVYVNVYPPGRDTDIACPEADRAVLSLYEAMSSQHNVEAEGPLEAYPQPTGLAALAGPADSTAVVVATVPTANARAPIIAAILRRRDRSRGNAPAFAVLRELLDAPNRIYSPSLPKPARTRRTQPSETPFCHERVPMHTPLPGSGSQSRGHAQGCDSSRGISHPKNHPVFPPVRGHSVARASHRASSRLWAPSFWYSARRWLLTVFCDTCSAFAS